MVIMRTRCEVECLCRDRVLVGVGWFIALSSFQGDRKSIVFPHLEIPPTSQGWPQSGHRIHSF